MSARSQRSTDGPTLSDTRDSLEKALQKSGKETDASDEGWRAKVATDAVETADLLERAGPGVSVLREWLRGNASLDDSKEEIDDLRAVIEKATDLLETIDIAALPDAIESDELPSAIDGKAIPNALVSGGLTDPVDFDRLTELVDYGKLLQVIDFRALMKEKSELVELLSQTAERGEGSSETEDEDDDSGLSLQNGLRTVYEKAGEEIDGLGGGNSTSGKRSSSNTTTFSTVPSERTDMRGFARFSTVSDR